VTKYKARLVAMGYLLEMGIDYNEAFNPVTRLETVRLIWLLRHNYTLDTSNGCTDSFSERRFG